MDNGIRTEATRFTVCGLPQDDADSLIWCLNVEWAGPGDLWAIRSLSRCWNFRAKRWDYEPSPSNRSEAFKRTHRRSKAVALRVATDIYPTLEWNGLCVRDGKLVRAS